MDAQAMTTHPEAEEKALESAQRTYDATGSLAHAIAVYNALAPRPDGEGPSAADMAAFGASDYACYKYPGNNESDQAKERAAFCEGAAFAASRSAAPTGAGAESDYSDSLRQQARWIREALDPATPDTQRIGLEDVDTDELEAAAAHIAALEKNTRQAALQYLSLEAANEDLKNLVSALRAQLAEAHSTIRGYLNGPPGPHVSKEEQEAWYEMLTEKFRAIRALPDTQGEG